MTTWQKAIKYTAMAFAVCLVVSIISGIVGVIASVSFLFGLGDVFENQNVGDMKNYIISTNVSRIEAEVGAVDFVVKTGESLQLDYNNDDIVVSEKNDKLVITQRERFLINNATGSQLTLTVPNGFIFEEFDINTGAGKLNVESIAANMVDFDLGAGEVNIENITAARKAEIDGGAGKLTIKDGTLNNLDLSMGVGELNLTGRLEGECDLDYGIGATNINLVGTADDYRIVFDEGLGNATLDGQPVENRGVYGNGSAQIEIDGGIGALKIDFVSIG